MAGKQLYGYDNEKIRAAITAANLSKARAQDVEGQSQLAANADALAYGVGSSVMSKANRLLGRGDKADEINRVNEAVQGAMAVKDQQLFGDGPGFLQNYGPSVIRAARNVAIQLPEMLAAGSVGKAVGGAQGALGAIVGQGASSSANQAITSARDAGLPESKVANYALRDAAIEGGLTLGFSALGGPVAGGVESMLAGMVKSGGKEALKSPAAKGIVRNSILSSAAQAGKSIPGEVAEELSIGVLQSINSAYSGVDVNALSEESLTAMAGQTVLEAIGMTGVVGAGQMVGDRMARKKTEPPTLDRPSPSPATMDPATTTAASQPEGQAAPVIAPPSDLTVAVSKVFEDGSPKTLGEIEVDLQDAGIDVNDIEVAKQVDVVLNDLLNKGYQQDDQTGQIFPVPIDPAVEQPSPEVSYAATFLKENGVAEESISTLDDAAIVTMATALEKQLEATFRGENEAIQDAIPAETPQETANPENIQRQDATETVVSDGTSVPRATYSDTAAKAEPVVQTVTQTAPVEQRREGDLNEEGMRNQNETQGQTQGQVISPGGDGGTAAESSAPQPSSVPKYEAEYRGPDNMRSAVWTAADGRIASGLIDGDSGNVMGITFFDTKNMSPETATRLANGYAEGLVKRGDIKAAAAFAKSGEPNSEGRYNLARAAKYYDITDRAALEAEVHPTKPSEPVSETPPKKRRITKKEAKPTEDPVSDDEFRRRILDAMMTEEGQSVPRAANAPGPESPGRLIVRDISTGKETVIPETPRRIGKVKEVIAEKKQESADAYEASKQRLRAKLDGKLMSGVDPEILGAVADVLVQGVRYKAWSFAEIVADLADTFGRQNIPMLRPYLERGWRAVQTMETVDTPDYDQVFKQYEPTEEATNDTRASEATGGDARSERTDAAGQGDAGVLAGASPEDVRTSGEGGNPTGTGNASGGSAGQGDSQADNTRVDERGRRPADDVGDSVDGTRKRRKRDRANVESASPIAEETKPATVAIRQNYHLTDPDRIVGGSLKKKFQRNQDAIEIVLKVERDNREPSQEELDILAGYMGWGAFGQELFQGDWNNAQPKEGWEDQDEWLRDHLGEKEWTSMQDSIINAHYTAPEEVAFIWDLLRKAGFEGGRVLEPSIGIGNFYSMMPRDLMEHSYLNGIELDKLTAKIAKLLHPRANIQQKGYQESQTPDDFYDVLIGNVPFANVKVPDARYSPDFSIHNYFFRKAIDQLKPGGVIAFITSNTTMDGKSQAKILRAQLSKQGDLIAAYRFPTGAFSKYAGTKVVADLVVIRKRKPGESPNGISWNEIVDVDTPSGEQVSVNEYWVNNPQNIFGTLNFGSGTTSGRPGMIVNPPSDLPSLMQNALGASASGVINTERVYTDAPPRPNDTDARQNTVVVRDNDVLQVAGEHLVPLIENVSWYRANSKQSTIDKKREQIADLIGVRELLRKVLDKQSRSEDAGPDRSELNRVYDAFVAKHGYVSQSDAAAVLRKARDPMGNALTALETVNADGKTYSKRPIFSKVTTRQKRSNDQPTVIDAYAMSRNDSLQLDMGAIASRANVTVDEAVKQLIEAGEVYKTGSENYEAADIFLSGNILRKIRETKEAISLGVKDLERSLSDLEKLAPTPIPYTQIEARFGSTWVPASDYKQFLADLMSESPDKFFVERFPGRWKIRVADGINAKPEATTMHGHPEVAFSRLVTAAMNNSTVNVYGRDIDGTKYLDESATREANAKIDELRNKYSDWIWSSSDRIVRLAEAYNETFNADVSPTFDNVPLTFEGMALQRGTDPFSLRKHQESAVWRGIVTGKGIYAHEVGTGKTLTMGALAMESKRLGLASKPMLFAHNANSMSVKNEIEAAYPGARILYVDNLNAANRDQTLAAIATDDWDLVVVPHSLVDQFQLKPETLQRLLQEEMDALAANALEAFNDSESSFKGVMPSDLDKMTDDDLKELKEPTAKELVKERMRLRARITKAQQSLSSGDNVFLEDMGVDMLMIDEAHVFKKQAIASKQRIKGLNKVGSERGTAMLVMSDYIRSINNGRGVHVFTGTPITNTLNEIYNIQRLVMGEEMAEAGVRDWDGWFNTFANSESNVELSSGGTWETFDRLVAFVNLPELRKMVGRYMDSVFADEMPEFVMRSSRDGRTENPVGRPYKQVHNEVIEMNDAQKTYSDSLKQRYIDFRDASKKEKREMMLSGGKNNPLVIEGEGVKLALDPRLLGIAVDRKDPSLKINKMIKNAMGYYESHPKATQMIFMDSGHSNSVTRTTTEKDGSKTKTTHKVFSVAEEIKRRLIEDGVPADQIVLFGMLTDKAKRAEAAERMQRGEIRFAIGSTATMGTGINAQNEMIAMHHLDAPWMPGELEQRNGRGHRQGNRWNTVHEHRYLTEGPQDGRRWQVLLTKDRFIQKFMRSKSVERVMEMDTIDLSDGTDTDETSDMDKTFSAAVGDPRIQVKAKLEKDVAKLEEGRDRHDRNIQYSLTRARRLQNDIRDASQMIARRQSDYDTFLANDGDFKIRLEGLEGGLKTYSDRESADAALKSINEDRFVIPARKTGKPNQPVKIGEYRGLDLYLEQGDLIVRGETTHQVKFSTTSLDGKLRNIPGSIDKLKEEIASDQKFIASADAMVGTPYSKQSILDAKKEKLAAIMLEMSVNPETSPSWLRAGAPIGSAVYWKGDAYDVSGYRGSDTILSDNPDIQPQRQYTDEQVVAEVNQSGLKILAPKETLSDTAIEDVVRGKWNIVSGNKSVGSGNTAFEAYVFARSQPEQSAVLQGLSVSQPFIEIPVSEATSEDGSPLFAFLQETTDPERSPGKANFNPEGVRSIGKRQMASSLAKPTTIGFNNETPKAPVRSTSDDQAGIAAADVVSTLSRIFGVTTRVGSVRSRSLGEYMGLSRSQNVPRVVRLAERAATSIAVQIHEIGHHLDRVYRITTSSPEGSRVAPRAARINLESLDYSPQGRQEEGFAEFIRYYLTEPNEIAASGQWTAGPAYRAPGFYQWFEGEFLKNNPKVRQQLEEARKYIKDFSEQSLIRKMREMIGNNPGDDLAYGERWKKNVSHATHELMLNWEDEFVHATYVDKAYRTAGGTGPGLRDTINVHQYAASSEAERALMDGIHDVATGAPINEGSEGFWKRVGRLLKNDQERKDVEVFAYARHTVWADTNLPGYNTGLDVIEAQKLIDDIKKSDPDQYARFEEIAVAISDVAHDLLRMRVRAGTMPSSRAEDIIARYGDNYFPMFRVMEGQKSISGGGHSFVNLNIGVPRRSKKGSGRPVKSPFDSIDEMALQYYGLAARGRINEKLRRMIDPEFGGVEGLGWVGVRVGPKTKPTKIAIKNVLDQLIDSGFVDPDDAKAAIISGQLLGEIEGSPSDEDLVFLADRHQIDLADPDAMQQLEKAATSEPNANAIITEWRPSYESEPGKMIAVSYDRDGNPLLYQYDAEIYKLLTNISAPHLALTGELLRRVGRIFKSIAVTGNATFAMLNLVRDYIGFQGRANKVKGLRSITEPIKQGSRYLNFKRSSILNRSSDSMPSDLLMFEQMGGSAYSRSGRDKASRRRLISRRLGKSTMSRLGYTGVHPRELLALIGSAGSNIVSTVENFVSMSDAPPRLSEMNAAIREAGFEPLTGGKFRNLSTGTIRYGLPEDVRIEAMMAASNATVNFKRGGRMMKALDVYMPFALATVNANLKFASLVSNIKYLGQSGPNGQQAARYATYIAATTAFAMLYYALRRDEEDYKNSEDYELDKYWTFGWDGVTYLRIPKPQDEAVVSNAVETILGYMLGDVDTRDVTDMLVRDIENRIPTGGGLVRGLGEVALNKDFYRDSEVESTWVQDRSTKNQYTDRTRDLSVLIGQFTSILGVSPMQAEHLINAVTANQYEKIHRLYEGFQGGNLSLENTPAIRAFYVNRHAARPISDFYDRLGELRTQIADAAAEGKEESPAALVAKSKMSEFMKYQEMLAKISEAQRTEPGSRQKYVPYMVGIAREALGYKAVDTSPNPLKLPPNKLPPSIVEVVSGFASQIAKQPMMLSGIPQVVPKDSPEGTNFADVRRRFRDETDTRLDYLEEHQNEPLVAKEIASIAKSKKFVDAFKRKLQPGELKKQEFSEDLKRHQEQQNRIRRLYETSKSQRRLSLAR